MKPHPFDAISFISGLIITGLGVLFLLPQTPGDIVDRVVDLGPWFWPLLLVAAGLAIVIPIFRPRDQQREISGPR